MNYRIGLGQKVEGLNGEVKMVMDEQQQSYSVRGTGCWEMR